MENTGIDVVLVMDSSGSMKKTDPLSLRIPAAKMFISLLEKHDRAALVSFSDEGYPIMYMTPLDGKKNKDLLLLAANKISSRGAYTNIYNAVQKGVEVITKDREPDRRQIIVLMTDGMMDTGNKDEDMKLTDLLKNRLIPDIKAKGIEIYTIAFTEDSDRKLMEEISAGTGGRYNLTLTDRDLHPAFTDIFESTKNPEMLPLEDNGFLVDKSIEEVTVVASKKSPDISISLESPDGKKHIPQDKDGGFNWFLSTAFDMVTISGPMEGRWKILYSTGVDKAYIISNMKLMTDVDLSHPSVNKPIPVKAWFEKDGGLLKKKEILETTGLFMELTPSNLQPIGMTLNKGEEEGHFTSQIAVQNPGTFNLKVIARGKTFQRERSYKFDVNAPPVAEEHVQPLKKEEIHKKTEVKVDIARDDVSWLNVISKFIFINSLIALIVFGIIKRDMIKNLIKRKKDD